MAELPILDIINQKEKDKTLDELCWRWWLMQGSAPELWLILIRTQNKKKKTSKWYFAGDEQEHTDSRWALVDVAEDDEDKKDDDDDVDMNQRAVSDMLSE